MAMFPELSLAPVEEEETGVLQSNLTEVNVKFYIKNH